MTTTILTGIRNANGTGTVTVNTGAGGTVAVGDLVICGVSGNVVSSLDAGWSATDNLGNTWQRDSTVVNGTSDQVAILSTRVTVAGSLTSVTLTPTNSVGRVAAWVDQPGVAVVSGTYVDKAPAGTTGNSVTPTATATGTLAQASEYLYAAVSMASGSTVSSAGGSFTLAGTNVSTNGTTDKRGAGEDQTVSATTTVTATMNITPANAWAMVIVTYLIAAPASVVPAQPRRRQTWLPRRRPGNIDQAPLEQADPAPFSLDRRRVTLTPVLRRRRGAQVITTQVAATPPPWVPQAVRRRVAPAAVSRRDRGYQFIPGQVIATPPPWPPQAVRRRITPPPKVNRDRGVQYIPAQVVPAPPPWVPQRNRRRPTVVVKVNRLRGAPQPVPAPVVLAAPLFVPQAGARRRIQPAAPRRAHVAQHIPGQHVAPPLSGHRRPGITVPLPAPHRGHSAQHISGQLGVIARLCRRAATITRIIRHPGAPAVVPRPPVITPTFVPVVSRRRRPTHYLPRRGRHAQPIPVPVTVTTGDMRWHGGATTAMRPRTGLEPATRLQTGSEPAMRSAVANEAATRLRVGNATTMRRR